MAGYKFLKRKGLDHLADDFCDFPLSSPATKIRRLVRILPFSLSHSSSSSFIEVCYLSLSLSDVC